MAAKGRAGGGGGGSGGGGRILKLELAGAKMGVTSLGNSFHFLKNKLSYVTYTQPLSLKTCVKLLNTVTFVL